MAEVAAGPEENRPPVIAILGMHRSGTSWLAGSLEAMGLELGDVATWAPNNPRGSREDKRIQHLHDDVLGANGGSWSSPPASDVWSTAQLATLQELVDQMDAGPAPWGFKDPRTLLLLDGWREVLGHRLRFVGIFRHPELVVRSMEARRRRRRRSRSLPLRRWTGRRGRRLWNLYNLRLVEEHRREPFPLIRFDQPQDRLLASLAVVGSDLGLSPDVDAAPFFEAAFVNEEQVERRVHHSSRRVWEYLVQNEGPRS